MSNKEIPVPIQHRILLQSGLSLLAMIAGLGTAATLKALPAAMPFVLTAMFLAGDATYLHYIAMKNRIIALTGTVLNVERTLWRRRPKALLLEVDGTALRVVLRNRLCKISTGDVIVIYLSDTTPLYSWFGIRQLASYLTLTHIKDENFRTKNGEH